MHRQTIRTFIEVRDGAVKVLHTDPVLRPRVKCRTQKGDEIDGKGSTGRRAEEDVQNP